MGEIVLLKFVSIIESVRELGRGCWSINAFGCFGSNEKLVTSLTSVAAACVFMTE